MDKLVEQRVGTCLPCLASTEEHNRDPLKPSIAPDEPWTKLYCDHWGPTRNGNHILVIIDGLSRYPEVIVVDGTSAEDNIKAFTEVFSRHSFPEVIHSDNGPPFNGNDAHLLQEFFKRSGIEHNPNHSAQDPEATGMVEAFMKHIKKIYHTAEIEKIDPSQQIQEHLLQFRATLHTPRQTSHRLNCCLDESSRPGCQT